ncbi:polyisoprenoid-binding protein YceI [Roseimicrobium gellanilyticum]|uniref:Polyisoprenoid-binding protein YceI n=1 Tax=Roseimicrobium gellanilyticum TaxID=748857 RepID=A0A366HBH6_9BACT|nr:YceI family protein [Roseimicrobium gellanilyticum]RBP38525.1 polyisoprenoid-binding protein YceI [Roseimicrobium gellanilyticum]
MKHLLFSAAVVLLMTAGRVSGATTKWDGSAEIAFSGNSTLHSWDGAVNAEPFVATVVTGDDDRPKSLSATVKVKAAGMDTNNDKRDATMHKSMKVADYPLIEGKFQDISFTTIMPDGKTPSNLPFSLTLLGKKHDVVATVGNWKFGEDTATFDVSFSLSLKQCGINVPSAMLVVRVGDTVKVTASVKLVRAKGN